MWLQVFLFYCRDIHIGFCRAIHGGIIVAGSVTVPLYAMHFDIIAGCHYVAV